MKNLIERLDKQFDHRVRLGIMSVLIVQNWVDFNHLKDTLALTDGRLASHIKALENAQYLEVRKRFVGRRPNTSYRVTPLGKKAFEDHLSALEQLLRLKPQEEE